MEKKRYANIDLLKTIAIVMVIALHSKLFRTDFITNENLSTYIQYAIRLICECVAIFIFVNGFLLIGKQNFDLYKHLKKTLKIFGVLIAWSFILTIVVKLIYREPIHLIQVIKNIFKGNKVIGKINYKKEYDSLINNNFKIPENNLKNIMKDFNYIEI